MAKIKRQNLEELNQTHAKLEGKEYQTLDQILGDSGGDRYGTFDEEEYLSQLNAMNRSDLQTHAIKMSLIPIDNTQILRESIESDKCLICHKECSKVLQEPVEFGYCGHIVHTDCLKSYKKTYSDPLECKICVQNFTII